MMREKSISKGWTILISPLPKPINCSQLLVILDISILQFLLKWSLSQWGTCLIKESGPFAVGRHPVQIALDNAKHRLAQIVCPGQLSLQLLSLIIHGRKKERTQDALFVPEVMVNRPHTGVASGFDGIDSCRFHPQIVKAMQRLFQNLSFQRSSAARKPIL